MAGASLCPRFHKAIELVGSRWTGAILQVLAGGRSRFTSLGAAIPDISDRMLSERLHALEAEGIVLRTVIPESPVRVEYELTNKGVELQRALEPVGRWAEQSIAIEGVSPAASSRPAHARRGKATPTSRTRTRQAH